MFNKLLRWTYWNLLPSPLRLTEILARLVIRRTGNCVVAGPFKGLSYVSVTHASTFVTKLLGLYEKELHVAVEEIIALSPRTCFNIGTGEGYYAVGLASRVPGCQIIGFEMSAAAGALTMELARQNHVDDRIKIHGVCNAEALAAFNPEPPCVVVCDIEGGEDSVLDPVAVPWLKNAVLLVELHEFEVAGIENKLKARFESTHSIQIIQQTDRSAGEFPYTSALTSWIPDKYRALVIGEGRPARMSWLYALPLN